MFDSLSEKLEGALKSLSGQGRINELNIAQTMREIRRALLDADVNYQVAKDFTERVKEQAVGDEVLTSVAPGQQLTKIVYDELVHFLGSENVGIELASVPPTVILVAGLQGSGKTTFCGKLALHLKSKGRAPMIAAADVYRPAAVDQLKTLAASIDIPVYSLEENGEVIQDAVRVAREAVVAARKQARDVLIIDTAGRMHVDERMMTEVQQIRDAVSANEILFVVDSMTGQDAVNTALEFNRLLNFDGVVLTKLDGDTRGGAALSIRSVVQKPIKFASTGEKLDALTPFFPDRMAQRILGMGDVVSFVEKAQEQFDETEADRLRTKMRSESFDLEDFLDQLDRIKKMGSIKDLVGMIPGIGRKVDELDVDDDAFVQIEAIIHSMTPKERRDPDLINGSRRRRVAQGAGVEVRDVNQLLKQFRDMRKMMKTMTKLMGKGRSVDLSLRSWAEENSSTPKAEIIVAVKLRLRRMGRRKRPLYAVVAADSRSPRDGRYIEDLGRYDSLQEPATVTLNDERIMYWLEQGAQPSETVRSILSRAGLMTALHLRRKGAEPEAVEEAVAAQRAVVAAKLATGTKVTAADRRREALAAETVAAKAREAEEAKARAEADAKAKADAEVAQRQAAEERLRLAEEARVEQEAANAAAAAEEAAPKPDAKAAPKADAKADAKAAPKADAKADAKAAPKADAKAAPKADAKAASKADAEPTPEAETAPEAVSDAAAKADKDKG